MDKSTQDTMHNLIQQTDSSTEIKNIIVFNEKMFADVLFLFAKFGKDFDSDHIKFLEAQIKNLEEKCLPSTKVDQIKVLIKYIKDQDYM